SVLAAHVFAMRFGGIQAGISSWWGPGTPTDTRVPSLLNAAHGMSFHWALYYEQEGYGDPSTGQLQTDLKFIRDHYASDPSYLRIDGKFVVFAYADPNDRCGMADRWRDAQAPDIGAYVVLKVFPGYRACQGDAPAWHQ